MTLTFSIHVLLENNFQCLYKCGLPHSQKNGCTYPQNHKNKLTFMLELRENIKNRSETWRWFWTSVFCVSIWVCFVFLSESTSSTEIGYINNTITAKAFSVITYSWSTYVGSHFQATFLTICGAKQFNSVCSMINRSDSVPWRLGRAAPRTIFTLLLQTQSFFGHFWVKQQVSLRIY